MKVCRPLGRRAYGSIPHLPGSKLGEGDYRINEWQGRICTAKARPGDAVIVEEKLDGTCVAVARIDGRIVPLIRAGYRACDSPQEQHQLFNRWAYEHADRFLACLKDGERLVGEWLALAHGTRYDLRGLEPFVAFDVMRDDARVLRREFYSRVTFRTPTLVEAPYPIAPEAAYSVLSGGRFGEDRPEGLVYRVEREGRVDFMAKWVRPDFVPGRYFPEVSGWGPVWNWRPTESTP